MDEESLLGRAREAMSRAYAPYSGYRVGAAILTSDGSVVTGCNVENVSYGLTVCAERAAAVCAVVEGRRDFRAVAVVTDGSAEVAPCGACRQVLAEFGPDMTVITEGLGGRRSWTLSELLPEAFDSERAGLGRKERGDR